MITPEKEPELRAVTIEAGPPHEYLITVQRVQEATIRMVSFNPLFDGPHSSRELSPSAWTTTATMVVDFTDAVSGARYKKVEQ